MVAAIIDWTPEGEKLRIDGGRFPDYRAAWEASREMARARRAAKTVPMSTAEVAMAIPVKVRNADGLESNVETLTLEGTPSERAASPRSRSMKEWVGRAGRWLLVALLLAAADGRALARTDKPSPGRASCETPFNVGFKVVTIGDGLKAAVWYPTAAGESRFQYFRDLTGAAAPAGTPANCGRFPLVVFSHGFGGCGTQSVFFTEELARHGYVVAAPDHRDAVCGVDGRSSLRFITPDESFSHPERWTEMTHSNRRSDLRLTSQWVLKSAEFASQIDPDRIGVAGHSLGGYTALGLVGGWKSWKDDRLKAALLFAPYAAPFVGHGRLSSVTVPVMYQTADRDLLITPSAVRAAYALSSSPKYYVQLQDGTHFDWTNLVCIGTRTISACLKSKPNARLINAYGIGFLDSYLKGQAQALERLDGAGLDEYQQANP
jgi:predicted dienelactone hydrolase